MCIVYSSKTDTLSLRCSRSGTNAPEYGAKVPAVTKGLFM